MTFSDKTLRNTFERICSFKSLDEILYFVHKRSTLIGSFKVVRHLPYPNRPMVILEDNDGLLYEFGAREFLKGQRPTYRSALDPALYFSFHLERLSVPLSGLVEVKGFAPDTCRKSKHSRLLHVIYKPLGTEHYVYWASLKKAKVLTVNSAVDPIIFVRKYLDFYYPELSKKILILEVKSRRRMKLKDPEEYHSKIVLQNIDTGEVGEFLLTYVLNNRMLKYFLGEVNYMPLNALVKANPDFILNMYFIQIVNKTGEEEYRSYKIGYTRYNSSKDRVKTIRKGWKEHSCIYFAPHRAIDIKEFEGKYKKIGGPFLPNRLAASNGVSEFIWSENLEHKWDELSMLKLSFGELNTLLEAELK